MASRQPRNDAWLMCIRSVFGLCDLRGERMLFYFGCVKLTSAQNKQGNGGGRGRGRGEGTGRDTPQFML